LIIAVMSFISSPYLRTKINAAIIGQLVFYRYKGRAKKGIFFKLLKIKENIFVAY
jgi:hypothetical protein